jgi:hypothetical protein
MDIISLKDYQEIEREKRKRLDRIIELLESQEQKNDLVLRALTSAIVDMAPRATQTITVGITPTFLVENTIQSLMRVEITNDDFGQNLYVANRDVIIPGGRLIGPQDTYVCNLRKGQKLYGIVLVATINAIVSYSESAYSAVSFDGSIIL